MRGRAVLYHVPRPINELKSKQQYTTHRNLLHTCTSVFSNFKQHIRTLLLTDSDPPYTCPSVDLGVSDYK